jgi:hypothetical protein
VGLRRSEFMITVGAMREVDALVDDAYKFFEEQERKKADRGEAHSDDWHLSFHGSQFPGDDVKACGRKALYSMIDTPKEQFTRKSRQLMEAGKDIENQVVTKLYLSGQLLSNPPWKFQTQFEDPEAWLTCTLDTLALARRQSKPYVIEHKTKYARVIEEMLKLYRGPDPDHIKQVKVQIEMANRFGPHKVMRCYNSGRMAVEQQLVSANGDKPHAHAIRVCPQHRHTDCLVEEEIQPPDYGYLYYISRDNPNDTWEFYFERDPKFYDAGIAQLHEWRDSFIKGELPTTQTEKAGARGHPFGWMWSVDPCRYCDYKARMCRPDHEEAVKQGSPIKLRDSAAVDQAKIVRGEYDFDLVHAAVLKRWGIDPSSSD